MRLTNFRGFEKLELALAPVSVIVGPNSSGKTTILHAISAAHRAYWQSVFMWDAHPVVKGDRIRVCDGVLLRSHTELLPIAIAEEIFRNGEVREGTTAEIDLEFEDTDPVRRLVVQLSYMRNKQLKLWLDVECPAAVAAAHGVPARSKHRPQRLLEALQRDMPVSVLVPAFYGVTLHEEFRTVPVVDELLQEGQQSRIVRNLIARLSATDLEELNAFLGRTVGARIGARTPAADAERVNPLVVRFRDNNGELDLSAAGAGVVNLIALFAALKWRQRAGRGTTVFLFDEPEAHLHPQLQGIVGDELATLVRGFSSAQLVAATHSVEMINRVGRREDAVLLAVDRKKGSAVALRTESAIVDELTRWADLTPFTSLNFLASRRLLFHEGPSDARILQRAAEVLFRNQPERLAEFKRWTLVPLDGTGHVPGIAALRKVIQPKVFPGLDSAEPVRLVLVRDRDRDRSPGLTSKTEGRVISTEVVWSRHSIESLFLDPGLLAQWLAASMPAGGTDEARLRQLVEEELPAVDQMPELNEPAVSELVPILLRESGERIERCVKEAQRLVREDPAAYQKGRDRARCLLARVQSRLPAKEQKFIRKSIADELAEARIERLSNPDAAVPEELRRLLLLLTSE
ncbi:MAG TPA: ATP-binding protein [Nannocystis sp.]